MQSLLPLIQLVDVIQALIHVRNIDFRTLELKDINCCGTSKNNLIKVTGHFQHTWDSFMDMYDKTME